MMPDLKKHPLYKVGDQVRLTFGTRLVGRVMEARGTYSPSGHVLYRVHIPMSPEPLILEVREDAVEKV
jgi:hypothetical protein